MHFRCVFTLLLCCVLVGLDWAEPIMRLNLHVTCLCIFMHMYFPVSIFVILYLVWCFSNCLSFSLPLSLFLTLVVSWHLNINPLHLGTHFVPRHLLLFLLLTPFHLTFGFMMRRPNRTSWRTFHDKAFIWNAKSFY